VSIEEEDDGPMKIDFQVILDKDSAIQRYYAVSDDK
jgi:hypothetical protein